METTIVKQPDIRNGDNILNQFNLCAPLWIKAVASKKKDIIATFLRLFHADRELALHLAGKWMGYKPNGLSGFLLNLGYINQIVVIEDIFPENFRPDFVFPDVEGWQDLGKQYGMDKWGEEYDMEDVRKHCVIHGDKSKWDVYPHDLIFIQKYLLYANNNGIDGYEFPELKEHFTSYRGNRFGNFTNWAKFWKQTSPAVREAIVERLISYS